MVSAEDKEPPADGREIRRAILRLDPAAWGRLNRYARWRARVAGGHWRAGEPEDLLWEAVALTLDGRRRWHARRVSLGAHLEGVMRSLSGHWAERDRHDAGDLRGNGDLAEVPAAGPDPERRFLAREQWAWLRRRSADDRDVSAILDGVRDGLTGAEIQARSGLSSTAYETAWRRLRRWAIGLQSGKMK